MREWKVFEAGPDDEGRRLDRILKRLLPNQGLSLIYGALRRGRIRVDSSRAQASDRLASGACISIDLDLLPPQTEVDLRAHGAALAEIEPPFEPGSADVLAPLLVLETKDLLFLNKPRGLLVHGDESLEALVRSALSKASSASLSFVPGPLHRLDRNTSGLVTFPKTARGARVFSKLLHEGSMDKTYLGLARGRLQEAEIWEDLLLRDTETRRSHGLVEVALDSTRRVDEEDRHGDMEGRQRAKLAVSRVSPLAEIEGNSLVLFRIETGRTHQIRAQAALHGFPLVGDAKYGGGLRSGGYFLHAYCLAFSSPPFEDCPRLVRAPLPPLFEEVLDRTLGAGCSAALIASLTIEGGR